MKRQTWPPLDKTEMDLVLRAAGGEGAYLDTLATMTPSFRARLKREIEEAIKGADDWVWLLSTSTLARRAIRERRATSGKPLRLGRG